MVRLTDRPDMTSDIYRGRKTTTQQQQQVLAPSLVKIFVSVLKITKGQNTLQNEVKVRVLFSATDDMVYREAHKDMI